MEQSKTEKINFSNTELTIQNKTRTNKRDSNLVHNEAKLSSDNNVLDQTNECLNSSSSNNSSTTIIDTSIPLNSLLVKKKSNSSSVVNNKESVKNVSKHVLKIADDRSTKMLGSKSIKNELQVMLKKGLSEKRLNGNSSPAIGKKVLITRKKSTAKDKICNGDRVSSRSVQLNNSKADTAYVLRHKVLNCNKTVIESIKSNHVINDMVLKSDTCGNNSDSFDSSSSDQKPVRDTNNFSQSDVIKSVNEKSKSKNWEF